MLSHNAPRVEGGSGSDAPDTTADKVPTPPPTSTVLLPLGFQILPASRDRNASRNEITLTFPQLRIEVVVADLSFRPLSLLSRLDGFFRLPEYSILRVDTPAAQLPTSRRCRKLSAIFRAVKVKGEP